MNKEQLKPLLAERRRWFYSPTCPTAEWYWAQYLLSMQTQKIKISPLITSVYTVHGEIYDVWTIQKPNPVYNQPTKLIIDPFPGFIVNLEDRMIRPLLPIPLFTKPFHDNGRLIFSVHVGITDSSSLWYMEGITKLIEQRVNFPLNTLELQETMQSFQKDFKPIHPGDS